MIWALRRIGRCDDAPNGNCLENPILKEVRLAIEGCIGAYYKGGHVYATAHPKSRMICEAFAKGSGWPIVPPAPLLPARCSCTAAFGG